MTDTAPAPSPAASPALEPWETWFERYRGTELAEVCIHLCRVSLERGALTAEDAHCIPIGNPAIRGAAMRRLRAFGIIRKDAVAYGTTEKSHAHVMFHWVLADSIAAQRLLDGVRRVTLRSPPALMTFPAADAQGNLLLAV